MLERVRTHRFITPYRIVTRIEFDKKVRIKIAVECPNRKETMKGQYLKVLLILKINQSKKKTRRK